MKIETPAERKSRKRVEAAKLADAIARAEAALATERGKLERLQAKQKAMRALARKQAAARKKAADEAAAKAAAKAEACRKAEARKAARDRVDRARAEQRELDAQVSGDAVFVKVFWPNHGYYIGQVVGRMRGTPLRLKVRLLAAGKRHTTLTVEHWGAVAGRATLPAA